MRRQSAVLKGREILHTNEDGKLKTFGRLESIPGIQRLSNVGFVEQKLTHADAVRLNKAERELPSAPDVVKANNAEFLKLTEKVTTSTKNLITQFERQEMLPMCKLQGLDKQLRSIRAC